MEEKSEFGSIFSLFARRINSNLIFFFHCDAVKFVIFALKLVGDKKEVIRFALPLEYTYEIPVTQLHDKV